MPKITKTQGPTVGDPVEVPGGEGGVAQPSGAVGSPAAAPPPTEPPPAPELRRPIVNDAKADHVAYAVAVYGGEPAWWDDEYSKKGLIVTLDRLADGTAQYTDGKVVDVTDPNPAPETDPADPGDEPAPVGPGDGIPEVQPPDLGGSSDSDPSD